MSELAAQQETLRPGFSEEQITALNGLTVAVKPSAFGLWGEAMPSVEVIEVPVARVDFDDNGNLAAFGVRRQTILDTIEHHGDPGHNSARGVGLYPDRIIMFDSSGNKLEDDARRYQKFYGNTPQKNSWE